jgi:ATP-dependent Clp protease protease subunit
MANPGWAFAMKGSGTDVLEFDIYDDIGESYWGDSVSAKDVRAALKASPDAKTIKLRVNSRGGDVFDGFAIYALIQAHPARVEAHVDGVAASMASIVIMAADEITVAAGAMIMIHNPWAFAMGEADELRETADLLDKMQGKSADVYVARTGVAREKIIEMMNAETWLTADEAKAQGFADVVMPAKKSAQAKAMARINLDGLKAPKSLIAACAQARSEHPKTNIAAPLIDAKAIEQTPKNLEPRPMKTLLVALGLGADATEAEALSAHQAREGDRQRLFALTGKTNAGEAEAQIVAWKIGAESAAKSEEALNALKRATVDAEASALIDQAGKDGKLPPADKATVESLYAAHGMAALKATLSVLKPIVGAAPVPGTTVAPSGDSTALTAEEKAVVAKLNITEDEYRASKRELAKG